MSKLCHVSTLFQTSHVNTRFDVVLTLKNPFDPVLAVTNPKRQKGLNMKNTSYTQIKQKKAVRHLMTANVFLWYNKVSSQMCTLQW